MPNNSIWGAYHTYMYELQIDADALGEGVHQQLSMYSPDQASLQQHGGNNNRWDGLFSEEGTGENQPVLCVPYVYVHVGTWTHVTCSVSPLKLLSLAVGRESCVAPMFRLGELQKVMAITGMHVLYRAHGEAQENTGMPKPSDNC
jgi:hypothetical protein